MRINCFWHGRRFSSVRIQFSFFFGSTINVNFTHPSMPPYWFYRIKSENWITTYEFFYAYFGTVIMIHVHPKTLEWKLYYKASLRNWNWTFTRFLNWKKKMRSTDDHGCHEALFVWTYFLKKSWSWLKLNHAVVGATLDSLRWSLFSSSWEVVSQGCQKEEKERKKNLKPCGLFQIFHLLLHLSSSTLRDWNQRL